MLSLEFVVDIGREILAAPGSLRRLPQGFKSVYRDAQQRNHRRWAANPHVVRSAKGFRISLNGNPDTPLYFNVGVAGVYEPHITSLFRKVLRPGMTVIDVGTNAGWFTLLSARRVGPAGKVFSFEPEPSNVAALRENVQLNGFQNVSVYNVALFDSEGEMALSLSPTASAWHSMVLHVGEDSIKVRTVCLDGVMRQANVDHVDLLKVDVEGAEPNVLLGARETLARTDHVVMEWSPQVWPERQALIGQLFERFQVFQIRYSPHLLRELTPETLGRIPPCNLYLRARRLSG